MFISSLSAAASPSVRFKSPSILHFTSQPLSDDVLAWMTQLQGYLRKGNQVSLTLGSEFKRYVVYRQQYFYGFEVQPTHKSPYTVWRQRLHHQHNRLCHHFLGDQVPYPFLTVMPRQIMDAKSWVGQVYGIDLKNMDESALGAPLIQKIVQGDIHLKATSPSELCDDHVVAGWHQKLTHLFRFPMKPPGVMLLAGTDHGTHEQWQMEFWQPRHALPHLTLILGPDETLNAHFNHH